MILYVAVQRESIMARWAAGFTDITYGIMKRSWVTAAQRGNSWWPRAATGLTGLIFHFSLFGIFQCIRYHSCCGLRTLSPSSCFFYVRQQDVYDVHEVRSTQRHRPSQPTEVSHWPDGTFGVCCRVQMRGKQLRRLPYPAAAPLVHLTHAAHTWQHFTPSVIYLSCL